MVSGLFKLHDPRFSKATEKAILAGDGRGRSKQEVIVSGRCLRRLRTSDCGHRGGVNVCLRPRDFKVVEGRRQRVEKSPPAGFGFDEASEGKAQPTTFELKACHEK